MPEKFFFELLYMPSIPDNNTSWRASDDDQQIIIFFHLKDFIIDEGQHDQMMNIDQAQPRNQYGSANNIPKNVVRLKKIYDLHDNFKKEKNYKTNISSM
jgi:hypothetical protein